MMHKFKITKDIKFNDSFRNKAIIGQFDLQESNYKEEFEGEINLNQDWNVGLIVGASGTGKTTIAKELFGEHILNEYNFDNNSVMDNMPENCSVKEITNIFSKVGFSSPPSWLKPYNVLSNGQKMRVELAYNLLLKKDIFCFDEFTSVVDRQVAKITSTCIEKAVRKENKKFIAISCHYDIIEWLNPDWIFDTNKMQFFFAKKNQDQNSNCEFIKLKNLQKQQCGIYLKSITI